MLSRPVGSYRLARAKTMNEDMISDADFHRRFLEKLGLKPGHAVLDFACGTGDFSIAAARIIGPQGKIVCLDRDRENLAHVMRKAGELELNNVATMAIPDNVPSVLKTGSFDFAFLYILE